MASVERTFDAAEFRAAVTLIELALREDLGERGDLTSQALIPRELMGEVQVVARQPGVLSGAVLARLTLQRVDLVAQWIPRKSDGDHLEAGDVVADLRGSVRTLLSAERTMLNFMTHLSGIASRTAQFVERVAGTRAVILDTRKTHPGYRLLEKYAVRCGGGTNHRLGLYDGVLIKDNHLAAWQSGGGNGPGRTGHDPATDRSIAAAIAQARTATSSFGTLEAPLSLEVEVDTLEQLADALEGFPTIVLLDNMSLDQLRQAVAMRDRIAPQVLLEASGGVTLETVRAIAEAGVERISVGGLTHSSPALDLALDWSRSPLRGN